MNNFKLFNLKEVADSQTGPFGSQLHQSDYVSVGTPMVTIEHLGVERFTHQNLPFVSDKDRDRLSKYILKEGDIVFSRVGSVDRCTYVTKEEDGWMFSGRCIRVRTNENAIGRYLNFYFRQETFKKMMMDISVGATMPSLNTKLMDNIPLRLPSLNIQKKIAKVLSDLDAKIELNNKINAELEAMAKTLYDYWFVQFDFPYSPPSEGCPQDGVVIGKPYKSSGGKMVWNEELKREIPEGWEVVELSDIANILMGQSPPGESYNEEGVGTVFYQGSTDFGSRFPTIRKFTTSPSRFARQGDILLSVRAPVGTMNIAKEDCCIGRGLASLNSKDNCISYLYEVMVNLKQIFDRRNVDGTTFGSITKDDLFSLKVIKPSKDVLLQFDKILNPCFEKQNKIGQENQELASLRDWLLPMLMNGQVSVGDVAVEKIKTATKNVSLDLYLAMIHKQIENTTKLNYGEVVTQKTVFHLNTFTNQKLEYPFINSNYGTYSFQLKEDLLKNSYLSKTKKGSGEVFVVTSSKENEVLEALSNSENKAFVDAINEVVKIYQTPLINKETENIELLNTVSKVILDKQSTDLDIVYTGMQEWKIEQNGFTTKADKFTKLKTKKMIDLIDKLGLLGKLLK